MPACWIKVTLQILLKIGFHGNVPQVKKEEITEGKIYSPVGKFAEWAKLEMHGKA